MRAQPLGLNDVLNWLCSEEAKPVLDDVRRQIDATGGWLKGPCTNFVDLYEKQEQLPKDPFLRAVTTVLVGRILRQSEIAGALPGAIASALAQSAAPNGALTVDETARRLGPKASVFLLNISERMATARPPAEPPFGMRTAKWTYLANDATARLVGRSIPRNDLAARMPALDAVTRAHGDPHALSRFRAASLWPLLATSRVGHEAFEQNGLTRAQQDLACKPYAAHPETVHTMLADGWRVRSISLAHEYYGSPVRLEQHLAADQLAKLFDGVDPKTTDARFFLLDKGGNLAIRLHERHPEFAHLCTVIEDTEQGVRVFERWLADHGKPKPDCAYIAVARTPAKLTLACRGFGEAVVHAGLSALADVAGKDHLPPDAVYAIFGYGPMGKGCQRALRRRGVPGEHIRVFDINPARCEEARADGLVAPGREQTLRDANVVITVTGEPNTLTLSDYNLVADHAVAINGGSGFEELGIQSEISFGGFLNDGERLDADGRLLGKFDGNEVLLGSLTGGSSERHFVLRTDNGKEVLAPYCGLVANLANGRGSAPELIQFEYGLQLEAMLWAAQTPLSPDIHLLPHDRENLVLTATQASLAKHGTSLETPDFRQVAPW